MRTISDEEMQERLAATRSYSTVILRKGPHYESPGAPQIIWEHGRRNFALREAKQLVIVLPLAGETLERGVGVFNLPPDETERILAEDPAVRAGVLTFEVFPCRGFPGDSLP